MDHFHLLFVTLLIFQESKNFPEEVLLFYINNEYEEHERHSQKKLMSKVPRSEKDRYKCHRCINRIHYNIQTKNIYGQNGGSIFDNRSNIFSNRIDLIFGLMILLSR